MLVEIDLLEAKRLKLTINQFLLIKLIIDEVNINTYKNVVNIKDEDINKLIKSKILTPNSKYSDSLDSLELTDEILSFIKKKDFFDEFYELYPTSVIRSDGSKDYLRTDMNRSRVAYNKIIGKSESKHELIMSALKNEISERRAMNKMGYMKRMFKWLTSEEYMTYAEKKSDTQEVKNTATYGTEVV